MGNAYRLVELNGQLETLVVLLATNIPTCPEEIFDLTNLVHLDLTRYPLPKLPPSIAKLQHLQSLGKH